MSFSSAGKFTVPEGAVCSSLSWTLRSHREHSGGVSFTGRSVKWGSVESLSDRGKPALPSPRGSPCAGYRLLNGTAQNTRRSEGMGQRRSGSAALPLSGKDSWLENREKQEGKCRRTPPGRLDDCRESWLTFILCRKKPRGEVLWNFRSACRRPRREKSFPFRRRAWPESHRLVYSFHLASHSLQKEYP